MRRPVFSHRHVFLFYALLGLGLAAYWVSMRRDSESNQVRTHFLHALSRGYIKMNRESDVKMTVIHKVGDAYPTPENEVTRGNALQVQALVKRTSKALQVLNEVPITRSTLKEIREQVRLTRYSLSGIIGQDSMAIAAANALLESVSILDVLDDLQILDTAQFSLWREDIALKINSAELASLDYLSGRMVEYDVMFDSQVPVLVPQGNGAIVGQPFRAELSLVGYSSSTSNLTFYVDGKRLNSVANKALYMNTFWQPGRQKLTVTVKAHDPLYKMERTFMKQFELFIQEI